jgi:hypothetical protein
MDADGEGGRLTGFKRRSADGQRDGHAEGSDEAKRPRTHADASIQTQDLSGSEAVYMDVCQDDNHDAAGTGSCISNSAAPADTAVVASSSSAESGASAGSNDTSTLILGGQDMIPLPNSMLNIAGECSGPSHL